ncbi:hypothetical protein LVD17_20525 [Fulvivirga ulvae]|uniref:DUF892 family protein n=1 Tax=Fulvivirga ulvae TaxID=2904245 RepID=UPI001F32F670|nr:DUF892 family protein [Fulvivirga ulvae]UII30682.1 hypothetical protein LVD17_20525 [Fulvivirga ulvae]
MDDKTNARELLPYYLHLAYNAERKLGETLSKLIDDITASNLKKLLTLQVKEKNKQQMRFEMLLVRLIEEPSGGNNTWFLPTRVYLKSITTRKLRIK